jgi:S-adenosylmethionine decarboxylase
MFEGTEKKLEVILKKRKPGLRSGAGDRWARVVQAGRARIISRISNAEMDAYLLSESSLFVWDDRILLITCGRTTPAKALPEILAFVEPSEIASIFYERKNPVYPAAQLTDFHDDLAWVESHFPGRSIRLGPADDDHIDLFFSFPGDFQPLPDATLELLMHDLNPESRCVFCNGKETDNTSQDTLRKLNTIYPTVTTDSHFFDKHGYSSNAIDGGNYYTVHVTPEDDGSYASFESNYIDSGCVRVIKELIAIFKPGRFTVVLTATLDQECQDMHLQFEGDFPGYIKTDKSSFEFGAHYMASFRNFVAV